MLHSRFGTVILCSALLGAPLAALAQQQPDAASLIAAQRQAMAILAPMDGVWRGPATTVLPSGETHVITQTERVGSFLDGSVKVMEGRGYEADGKVGFNALGIISHTSGKGYTLHSYAQGYAGDFKLQATADGFVWEIPAGPMTMRFTATIKDGIWHEIGERIVAGKDPVRYFEMRLQRVGDTSWPGEGTIQAK
jgi:hypothetical protein